MEPSGKTDASIIWLHGLGADATDFEPIVPELHLPESLGIRFVFPNAPVRPITINDGQEMQAWYDFIPHSEYSGREDIITSSQQIEDLIQREIDRGVAANRIILAGFSQGGVIALYTALRYPERLAGIIALSTYLYDFSATEAEQNDANLGLRIFMAHGTGDPMIPIMRAATARENLIRLGHDVRWSDYPMGHQVCLEEVEEISHFIQELLV